MADRSQPSSLSPAVWLVGRVVVYYALLLGAAAFAASRGWHGGVDPSGVPIAPAGGGGGFPGAGGAAARAATVATEATLASTVALAMIGALLLALPVAWIYVVTRARRGYQQSVVQTLVILPVVVAGVVVLVKYSLALAFSLAGIVAAVRFRNTLDDSKDAVYVFLVTAIGLAAAVDLPVAAVLSALFNLIILALWYTDFGRTPPHLDGRMAAQRLRRARELASTGTFVARMDEEVFRDMTAEQLEGIAERARRRAQQHDPERPGAEGNGDDSQEAQLLVRAVDVATARAIVESRLGEHAKRWRYGGAEQGADGSYVLEYVLTPKKGRGGDELLGLVCADDTPGVLAAELH